LARESQRPRFTPESPARDWSIFVQAPDRGNYRLMKLVRWRCGCSCPPGGHRRQPGPSAWRPYSV